MVEAMDQIFSLAAWMSPLMLPVVSSANTTSTRCRSLAAGSTGGSSPVGGSTGGVLTASRLRWAG